MGIKGVAITLWKGYGAKAFRAEYYCNIAVPNTFLLDS